MLPTNPLITPSPLISSPPSSPMDSAGRGRAFLGRLKALLSRWRQPRRRRRILTTKFNWLSTTCSSMAITAQLKQVFTLIDTNGDGKISPLELEEVLLCLGGGSHDKASATREAEGMVKEVDRNGDGFIDLDEFMQVVDGDGGRGEEVDLREAFLVFDADRNGFISAEELRRVLVGLGHEKCSLRDCRHMIRGVDMNGDGLVDFEEFRIMMASGRAF